MKKFFSFFISLLICFNFFGCGNNNKSYENKSLKNITSEPVDISKGANDSMLNRSIYFEGDSTRISEKLNIAKNNPEKPMNICFLGDSITQGSLASDYEHQYTKLFEEWWKENISAYAQFFNAGIGATDSYLGVHRVQKHVLDYNPDIIFIEFINDTDDDFYANSMNSLLKKCLSRPNKPAVILIEMTKDNGTCPQNAHSKAAKAYGVPMISYHDVIMPEIEAGTIKWEDISPDDIHPNDKGHAMLAQILENYIVKIQKNNISTNKISKDIDINSISDDKYTDSKFADRESTDIKVIDEGNFKTIASFNKFENGWETQTGGSITFEMEFKNLGALYLKTVDGLSGMASVSVDGEEISLLRGDFTDGWGNWLKADEIYTSDKKATHTVKVTVIDGDKKQFKLMAWLLS